MKNKILSWDPKMTVLGLLLIIGTAMSGEPKHTIQSIGTPSGVLAVSDTIGENYIGSKSANFKFGPGAGTLGETALSFDFWTADPLGSGASGNLSIVNDDIVDSTIILRGTSTVSAGAWMKQNSKEVKIPLNVLQDADTVVLLKRNAGGRDTVGTIRIGRATIIKTFVSIGNRIPGDTVYVETKSALNENNKDTLQFPGDETTDNGFKGAFWGRAGKNAALIDSTSDVQVFDTSSAGSYSTTIRVKTALGRLATTTITGGTVERGKRGNDSTFTITHKTPTAYTVEIVYRDIRLASATYDGKTLTVPKEDSEGARKEYGMTKDSTASVL